MTSGLQSLRVRFRMFLLLLLAMLTTSLSGSVIRVKPGVDLPNSRDGDTWGTATNLQRALSIAVAGDEIWVASGVYYPDAWRILSPERRGDSLAVKS